MSNPFKLVEYDGVPIQEGRLPGSKVPDFGRQGVETVICVRDGDGSLNEVMKLSGVLWEPSPGSVIELGEPDRDAKVLSQVYMVVIDRLASVVCLADPATSRAEA